MGLTQRKQQGRMGASNTRAEDNHAPEYEFGGPVGALGAMLGLPVGVVALTALCTGEYCVGPSSFSDALSHLPTTASALWDPASMGVVLGWFAFQVVLERVLPFTPAQGVVLSTGERLSYRISGHLQLWVSVACVLAMHFFSPWKLWFAYDHFLHLAVASVVVSLVLSTLLYIKSFAGGALLAKGGSTGNAVYDFWAGRELNPRLGSLDLKQFCELRPGLIGWAVLNLAMALTQLDRYGSVSPSMVLVNVFQGLYVWDALYNEKAILTTMDITTDGFGYMLVFGDLSWVPFTYSIQARYLVDHDAHLSAIALCAISALCVCGYIVFRGANGQKDAFRSDPNSAEVKHLKYMTTASGRKLLISGYWGTARKINYTGDWMMGLGWCLFCGFSHFIPYWYAVYFAILLIHRASRDNHMCAEKYGKDWERYKKHVPYVFIPWVI